MNAKNTTPESADERGTDAPAEEENVTDNETLVLDETVPASPDAPTLAIDEDAPVTEHGTAAFETLSIGEDARATEHSTAVFETLPLDDGTATGVQNTTAYETLPLDGHTAEETTTAATAHAGGAYAETTAPIVPPAAPTTPATSAATATTAEPAPAPEIPVGAPRTRWAGIVWGLVLAAAAVLALITTIDASWREAVGDWWLSLNGVSGTAYAFILLGGIAVICGIVGVIGRAQRTRITRLASR